MPAEHLVKMVVNGKCHCGNIAFELAWQAATPGIAARACGCSFCVKHGGLWTSRPDARLSVTVRDAALVSKYAFATRTATFHVCARCGAVPLVTSAIAGHLYAVVNVNTFENVDPASVHRAESNFEGEDVESRLARRSRNWIADVRIVEGVAANRPQGG